MGLPIPPTPNIHWQSVSSPYLALHLLRFVLS
uniref:Uncharacterized protein n=1 Tax=Anguilla anguilla TaxID=7936 RepID=A0A0E9XJQ9_ANGAN